MHREAVQITVMCVRRLHTVVGRIENHRVGREPTRWRNGGHICRVKQEKSVHALHVQPLHPVTDKGKLIDNVRREFIAAYQRGHEVTTKKPNNRGQVVGKGSRNLKSVRATEGQNTNGNFKKEVSPGSQVSPGKIGLSEIWHLVCRVSSVIDCHPRRLRRGNI